MRIRLLLLLLVWLSACGRESAPALEPSPILTPAAAPTSAPTERVRFVAVGDIGEGNDVQRRVGERIAALHREEPIDVLMLLGDIIYPDGAGHRYGARFAEPWRAVLEAGIPMAAALGNHDVQTRAGDDVMALFEMPARYHSFRLGPVAFYALDTNRMDGAQIEWLRGELGASDAAWNVPFMHAPAYSSGSHGSTGYVQRALDPVAREFELPLVLAGHDHNYERTHPIAGAVYVVAGTGCCLRAVGRSDFTAAAFSEPGVLVAEADAERFVLRFVHADGRVMDEAELGVPERVPAGAADG